MGSKFVYRMSESLGINNELNQQLMRSFFKALWSENDSRMELGLNLRNLVKPFL